MQQATVAGAPMKTYFIKFLDETVEESLESHGGHNGGYSSLEKALQDAIDTGDGYPFVILDNDMNIVHKEADYE